MRRIVGLTLPACLIAALLSSGCNLLAIPFYLLAPEDKTKASMQELGSEDKDKPAKVLIWTWADRSAFDLEIPSADRNLAQRLETQLKARCQQNKEYISVIPFRKADQYRNGREDIDPLDAGKHFKADYVIYLEIDQFSINVGKSYDTLLQGRAKIRVTLYDLAKKDDPKNSILFECVYPPEGKGGMEVNEFGEMGNSKEMFAESFLNYVSRELVWKFTAHPTEEANKMQ